MLGPPRSEFQTSLDVVAHAKPIELVNCANEPFKVLYEAPDLAAKAQKLKAESNVVKFKHSLPTYDYDKVMSRVKPMMQLHD